jgi:hypothetical protein
MDMQEKHTHPIKPTLKRTEVSSKVLALAEEIRDVLRCEELWFILQRFEDDTRKELESFIYKLVDDDCGCKFVNGALELCDHHTHEILVP